MYERFRVSATDPNGERDTYLMPAQVGDNASGRIFEPGSIDGEYLWTVSIGRLYFKGPVPFRLPMGHACSNLFKNAQG